MKPTLVEHALCTSEWLLVCLEGSAQGIFRMELSLTIVMVDREMLLICIHNSCFFFKVVLQATGRILWENNLYVT